MDLGEDINIKQCFCRDEDTCPPKGTIDLFKCSGSPMFASLPHFYLADPKLLEGIESGLNPSKEKHGIAMLVEMVCFYFLSHHNFPINFSYNLPYKISNYLYIK